MKRFLLPIAVLLISFGAQSGQKAGTDDRIYDQVRMRLSTDPYVKGGAFNVNVKDGVVTLKGRVDSDHARDRATKLAKKVKGVKDIDNQLSVGPPK